MAPIFYTWKRSWHGITEGDENDELGREKGDGNKFLPAY